jgi:hypothetical protein
MDKKNQCHSNKTASKEVARIFEKNSSNLNQEVMSLV